MRLTMRVVIAALAILVQGPVSAGTMRDKSAPDGFGSRAGGRSIGWYAGGGDATSDNLQSADPDGYHRDSYGARDSFNPWEHALGNGND